MTRVVPVLEEITGVRQDDPELRRRWFHDDYFDLFVWQSPASGIVAFQLCYDIQSQERVLSWRESSGFSHNRVDSGEALPEKNMTPILVADGVLPIDEVLPKFSSRSRAMERAVSGFILSKLREYGSELHPPGERAN